MLREIVVVCVLVFFFQAEDGIRDRDVTGVQTCALPDLDAKDVVADVAQFVLDLDLVVLDDGHLVGVALLFDGGHDTPGCTAGSNDILVGHREEVALLDGEFLRLAGDLLHVGDHLVEALGLLGELGLVY